MSLILFSTDDVKIDYVFLNWRNAELLLLLLFLINWEEFIATCDIVAYFLSQHFRYQ